MYRPYTKYEVSLTGDVTPHNSYKHNVVARKIDTSNMTINLLQQRCKNLN